MRINFRLTVVAVAILLTTVTSCGKNEIYEPPFEYTSLEGLIEYNNSKISITQGIAGTLMMKEGNCMPMIGGSSSCNSYPIKKTIKIFEYTTIENIDGWGPSYDDVHTNLISQSNSDIDGFFQIKLSPGKYSVFISEKGKYYASGLDGVGGISPIEIKKDSVLQLNLKIDYAAY